MISARLKLNVMKLQTSCTLSFLSIAFLPFLLGTMLCLLSSLDSGPHVGVNVISVAQELLKKRGFPLLRLPDAHNAIGFLRIEQSRLFLTQSF